MSTKNMHDACRTVSPEDKTMKVINVATPKNTTNHDESSHKGLVRSARRPVEIKPQGMGSKIVQLPNGKIGRFINGTFVEV